MLKEFIVIRELVALCGYLLCLLLHIIAMSTTYWATLQTNNNGDSLNFGLWRECHVTSVSHVCTSFYTGDEDIYKGNEWKNGAQILMLVALVSILAEVLLSLSIMLVEKINRSLREAFGVLMCLLGSYFTCSLLVLLIFSHEISKIENVKLSWSFYILPCSMVLDIISCVLGAPLIDKKSTCYSNRSISIVNNKPDKDLDQSSSNNHNRQISDSTSSSRQSFESGYQEEPIKPRDTGYARKYQNEDGIWMVSF